MVLIEHLNIKKFSEFFMLLCNLVKIHKMMCLRKIGTTDLCCERKYTIIEKVSFSNLAYDFINPVENHVKLPKCLKEKKKWIRFNLNNVFLRLISILLLLLLLRCFFLPQKYQLKSRKNRRGNVTQQKKIIKMSIIALNVQKGRLFFSSFKSIDFIYSHKIHH